MPVIQILHRRDTAANWTSANPVLGAGEYGLDTTSMRVKIGDGTTAWNSLAYQMNTVLNGSGAPAGGSGVNGDVYLDTTGKNLHVKAAGTWGAAVSLQGPQGIQGNTGNTGAGTPTGGTPGQVLQKTSGTDYATTFGNTPVDGTTLEVTGNNVARVKDNGVTLAKMADIASASFLGRVTASLGDPEVLTATQATALLNAANTTLKGLMEPADKIELSGLHWDVVAQGGADPTGVVDATAIIQSAINTVGTAGGGVVYLPKGEYRVSANINVTSPFVTIKGASRVASKIRVYHATGNVFTVGAAAIFTRFDTLRIEGATNVLRTADWAVEFVAGASNSSMQWVDIIYMWSGIKASAQLVRLEDMNIREMGMNAPNGCGVLNDTFTDQYLKAIVMDNPVPPWGNAPGGPTGFAGVRITNLSSLLMADCQIIHCGTGLDVAPAGTNTIPSIYCMNTFFDNCVIGARFQGSATGFIYRNRFMGVWFSSNVTAGVSLNNPNINGLDFIGCEFYGNPIGIDAASAQEWSVRASRLAGNTTAAVRTTAGAAHSFSITDNIIGNVAGFGANGLGVNVQAGTYGRYQILDNRGLDSNTTPGITDLGTTTYVTQKNVANNMGAGLLTGTQTTLAATLSIANTETEVTGFTAPANNLKPGTVIRFQASGIQTNTTAASTSVHRIRIGPTTLTGPIVGSWSSVLGTTARTSVPFYIIGQVTILSATTAIATLSVRTDGLAYAAPTTTITAAVTIATNADQRVQLTSISGAATTTWNYFASEVQVVKA